MLKQARNIFNKTSSSLQRDSDFTTDRDLLNNVMGIQLSRGEYKALRAETPNMPALYSTQENVEDKIKRITSEHNQHLSANYIEGLKMANIVQMLWAAGNNYAETSYTNPAIARQIQKHVQSAFMQDLPHNIPGEIVENLGITMDHEAKNAGVLDVKTSKRAYQPIVFAL